MTCKGARNESQNIEQKQKQKLKLKLKLNNDKMTDLLHKIRAVVLHAKSLLLVLVLLQATETNPFGHNSFPPNQNNPFGPANQITFSQPFGHSTTASTGTPSLPFPSLPNRILMHNIFQIPRIIFVQMLVPIMLMLVIPFRMPHKHLSRHSNATFVLITLTNLRV